MSAAIDRVRRSHAMAWSTRSVRQDVVRIGRARHELVVLVQRRLPLIHVAAHEPVEVVEAQAARPAIERPDLAGLPVGRVVVLAEPRRGVAVLPQHLGDRADVLADDAGVAVVAGGGFGDHAVAGRVVVAAGEQRRARRRAERRRVEARVAQPVCWPRCRARASASARRTCRTARSRHRRSG